MQIPIRPSRALGGPELSPGHTSIHHIHHTLNTLNTLNTPHTPYTSLSTCAVSHTAVIQQHTAAIQQLTAHTSQQSIHHQYIAHITRNITKSRAPYTTTFELVGRHSKKSTATWILDTKPDSSHYFSRDTHPSHGFYPKGRIQCLFDDFRHIRARSETNHQINGA